MTEQAMGRNVEQIRKHATRVIRGSIPREVRAELMAAVKAGLLGQLKRDGLKPEIFFHPDHKHGAMERQRREAAYAVECIAKVVGGPSVEERVEAAFASAATTTPAVRS